MMEKVDLVLMGAEGVVESGGIINKVSIELLQLVNDESFQQHSTDSKSDSMLREGRGGEGRGGVVCSCLLDDISLEFPSFSQTEMS